MCLYVVKAFKIQHTAALAITASRSDQVDSMCNLLILSDSAFTVMTNHQKPSKHDAGPRASGEGTEEQAQGILQATPTENG